ncbi:NmrA family NAD(P)-binding protein [Mycolicibacterium sp. F2034L]|uniref:NmrA family NAD(P)-binding protein n=1 Tax=Mycolicibacterium sp. F2034L TaxID=2926422 RepID=UPI001FF5A56C|nr:NmrA family NAD(P)-binding protein [Mycolicibacterium sp. F2034L]MCK0172991.1 NmrA family NAD(P)-binding protein [Mycolicibacterium sp. F2034L]
MLLITGPTGNVGQQLVDLLRHRQPPGGWRVASRHPDELARRLGDGGAEISRLDFNDRSTWTPALSEVRALFLLFPLPSNRTARNAILPFLRAAQDAGCRDVVYISVVGADKASFIPHFKVESALKASAMDWTILQCGFFMQNLHRAISTHGIDIVERGELFIPAGSGRTSFLDARDAAGVAAMVLENPGPHRNRLYRLTGATVLSMDQVAEALSDALGYPVRYTHPGLIRFASRLRSRGVGWDTIGFMSAVYTLTRFGRNQPVTDEVEQLVGRPPRTLQDFLRDSAWRWRHRDWT